ncbi:MAG: dihydrodipicolinate synthase family protein [Algoriphagus sp.]|mgnify:FL=1|jgi:2-dehydro-3-deoxy-D-pentonate aldolase|uniref:dihydrodipicolinate synthase family protein n=2 Tax=Algoriphagus sp. TaxID=1872435 RepID=UPI002754C4A5|nr:dihydrodipicolinate synthase family protein [Algoriphagus sp.]MDP4747507.1 dihydrodipicolinate synthase family protein [Algoriphagus sp.]MDP4838026.1 dihydrodipicolinate synthase family protein [Algoriphagus sp.]MDP4904505.1 dihydrodipicolinate synthase family protein [Algoriphagus sp.]MDP4957193.1 dihydrodipicolinate synthase family protein [Algoriphagus sp.]
MTQSTVFNGIIPPMITPLKADFSLDINPTERLIEYLIEGGVHGIFILGTTGEFAGLSSAVKRELIQITCQQVKGRVPILVGVTDCSFTESIELAAIAHRSGAEAVVAAPPFYMNIEQEELINYYQKLADIVELPLFLYDMPSHVKINIEVETAVTLSKHPNIIGIKDSSGKIENFQALCEAFRQQPEFKIFVGPEEILAETLLIGGNGGVTGGANLFPELYVALYEAFQKKEYDAVKKFQETILFLSNKLYQHGTYQSSYLKGLKTAMSLEGLCEDNFALPLFPHAFSEKSILSSKLLQVKERVKQSFN